MRIISWFINQHHICGAPSCNQSQYMLNSCLWLWLVLQRQYLNHHFFSSPRSSRLDPHRLLCPGASTKVSLKIDKPKPCRGIGELFSVSTSKDGDFQLLYGGFHIVMGVPPNGWFLLGNIPLEWMIWGYPHVWAPYVRCRKVWSTGSTSHGTNFPERPCVEGVFHHHLPQILPTVKSPSDFDGYEVTDFLKFFTLGPLNCPCQWSSMKPPFSLSYSDCCQDDMKGLARVCTKKTMTGYSPKGHIPPEGIPRKIRSAAQRTRRHDGNGATTSDLFIGDHLPGWCLQNKAAPNHQQNQAFDHTTWLVVWTPLKNISQLGLWNSQYMGK